MPAPSPGPALAWRKGIGRGGKLKGPEAPLTAPLRSKKLKGGIGVVAASEAIRCCGRGETYGDDCEEEGEREGYAC